MISEAGQNYLEATNTKYVTSYLQDEAIELIKVRTILIEGQSPAKTTS